MLRWCWCSEPDYEFEKELNDADAYEKETAEFECEVNDEEAPVQWFREDKVCLSDHVLAVVLSCPYSAQPLLTCTVCSSAFTFDQTNSTKAWKVIFYRPLQLSYLADTTRTGVRTEADQPLCIGVGDGGICPRNSGEKYFSRKYCVKFRHFVTFSYIYFRAKMSCHPQNWLSSYRPTFLPSREVRRKCEANRDATAHSLQSVN